MSSDNIESQSTLQMAKIFRSFELNDEWQEFRFYEKAFLPNLPKLVAGYLENQFLSYYFSRPPAWRVKVRKLLRQKRIAPNYVMTGPPKAGSSDLVSHLLLHPNVLPPLAKEILLDFTKDWRFYYPTEKQKQQLEQKTGNPVRCGYLEPRLHNMITMNELHHANPGAKIIITLRDPVSRAYSDWKYELLIGGQRIANHRYFRDYGTYINRALDLFPSIPMETVRGVQVLQHGMYYKAVEHWINCFGKENVMILDVADYFSERKPTLDKIQEFLELPVVNIPEYGKKANENPIKRPPADAETKAKLMEFYKPHNEKLFNLIGKEFNWQ